VTAVIHPEADPVARVTLVAELDAVTIAEVAERALAARAHYGGPIIVELRYVADPGAAELVAGLHELGPRDIRVVATAVGTDSQATAHSVRPDAAAAEPRNPRPTVTDAGAEPSYDPFGLDHAFRAQWLPALRFLFERYWRVEVTGIGHVPARGPALIAANHSGALPLDAFMLGAALEFRHPTRRCLRMLYDRFVDDLPWIGPVYRRLGGVSSSFATAELLLRRGEVVGLFPEGIAGLEKRWPERYRLRQFKTGTARLSIRTGSPVVPLAIVGAEEACPVAVHLYRAGRLVGVPWIPVTPLFPICGLAGALPLPTKWHMRFCPPIHPPAADGRSEDDLVAEMTGRLRDTITAAITDLLAKRRGIFV
jgi:1-acyl-sn-glycerol-3-phosphate acyltransferase